MLGLIGVHNGVSGFCLPWAFEGVYVANIGASIITHSGLGFMIITTV